MFTERETQERNEEYKMLSCVCAYGRRERHQGTVIMTCVKQMQSSLHFEIRPMKLRVRKYHCGRSKSTHYEEDAI